MRVYINPKALPVFASLFGFYKTTGLDLSSPYEAYTSAAEKYVESLESDIKEMILHSSFDPNSTLFRFTKTQNDNEKYLWIFGFQNFYRAVNNLLSNYVPESLNDRGAERQTFLKREAFEHIGYNQPKLSRNKSSYGLLFE